MGSMNDPTRGRKISPLSEELLLDWVDGRVSPKRAQELADQSGRPGLQERVAQMQANRRALQGLPDERAPAVLMERVLAALERDSLLGDGVERGHDDALAPIMFSERAHHRRTSSWVRYAMAAGLLLMVGGGAYVAIRPGTVANHRVAGKIAAEAAPMSVRTGEVPRTAVAAADTGNEIPSPPAPPANTAKRSEQSVAAAPVEFVGPVIPPINVARASELAREGRLMVRVRVANSSQARSLAGLGSRDRGWRMRTDVPAQTVAALAKVVANEPHFSPTLMARETLEDAMPLLGPAAARTVAMPDPLRGASTYVLDVADSAEALEIAKADLSAKAASVEFAELGDAGDSAAANSPADVLWWTQNPAAWEPRIRVPVLVERGSK